MTPVPEGIISTSTGPAEPTESVVEEAIEEEIPAFDPDIDDPYERLDQA